MLKNQVSNEDMRNKKSLSHASKLSVLARKMEENGGFLAITAVLSPFHHSSAFYLLKATAMSNFSAFLVEFP